MFIGDGMSLSTVTAARELRRQRNSMREEEDKDRDSIQGLIWDHFPAAALAQVRNTIFLYRNPSSLLHFYIRCNFFRLTIVK